MFTLEWTTDLQSRLRVSAADVSSGAAPSPTPPVPTGRSRMLCYVEAACK